MMNYAGARRGCLMVVVDGIAENEAPDLVI
jgi:hypothetical protein